MFQAERNRRGDEDVLPLLTPRSGSRKGSRPSSVPAGSSRRGDQRPTSAPAPRSRSRKRTKSGGSDMDRVSGLKHGGIHHGNACLDDVSASDLTQGM